MELSAKQCGQGRVGGGGDKRCTYWVYGWLDLIGNDELDSRRLERILWIESDHEMKDFILEIFINAVSDKWDR
jgi:hypothetical protein